MKKRLFYVFDEHILSKKLRNREKFKTFGKE